MPLRMRQGLRSISRPGRHWALILIPLLFVAALAGRLIDDGVDDASPLHRPPASTAAVSSTSPGADAPVTVLVGRAPDAPQASSNADDSRIRANGERLSVAVAGLPLQVLLDEISRQSGVAILLADELADSPVSIQLPDLPIEQGLQRILDRHDSFFLYDRAGERAAQLSTVWVYPRGRGREFMPLPAGLQRALTDGAPVDAAPQAALDRARAALADPDEQLRLRSLHAALQSGVEFPEALLHDVILRDPSPQVRAVALTGLADDGIEPAAPTQLALLNAARADPDPEVSALAAHLLDARRRAAPATDSTAQDQPEGESPPEASGFD